MVIQRNVASCGFALFGVCSMHCAIFSSGVRLDFENLTGGEDTGTGNNLLWDILIQRRSW
jgi:hypothetical protein